MLSQNEIKGDVTIVHLDGQIVSRATGPLCDQSVERIRAGYSRLVVECGARTELTPTTCPHSPQRSIRNDVLRTL